MAEKTITQLQREALLKSQGHNLIPDAPIYRMDTNEARMAQGAGSDILRDTDPSKDIHVMGPDGTMITRRGVGDFIPSAQKPSEIPEELSMPTEYKKDITDPSMRYKGIRNKMSANEELSDDELNFYDQYKKDPRSFDKLMGAMQEEGPLKPKWGK